MNASPPQTAKPSPLRIGFPIAAGVLLLLVVGQLAVLKVVRDEREQAREAVGKAEEMKAKAELLVGRAKKALDAVEKSRPAERKVEGVAPLPRHPLLGRTRPLDPARAQIPPPPPRMHEITGSNDPVGVQEEPAESGAPKMRTTKGKEALELAKLKEADQDMMGAIKQLAVANDLEPNHPQVLYRLGILFEKLGNESRATKHFQAVAAMEGRAGALADLATHHLKGADPDKWPGGMRLRRLSIGPAYVSQSVDEQGTRAIKLSLSIRAAAGQQIDPQAVVPYIYFYDLADGGQIMPCDGEQPPVEEVNPWRSGNPDYQDPEEELLDVTYHIPKTDGGVRREFFGYVVKLYYRDEIQDVLVEPRVLIELLSGAGEGGPDTELDAMLFGN